MGLFSFLRSLKKSNREMRILVLGLDNAGKTSFLKNLGDEEISNIKPTQGFNVKTVSKDGIKLTVWDIGGQETIRAYWRNYYQGTNVLIYIVDSSDIRRLRESALELEILLKEPLLNMIPVIVFANKQDLANSATAEQIATNLELNAIRDRPWFIQPCSVKQNNGIKEGMSWVMSQSEIRL